MSLPLVRRRASRASSRRVRANRRGLAAASAFSSRNEVSGDLSVIDPASQRVIATVPLGKRPRGIKVSPDKHSLYIALSGSPIGGPGVDRDTLPPADRAADGIGEVDTSTYTLRRIIHAGVDPEQLDVSADGARMFVANEDTAQVSVVDLISGAIVGTAAVGSEPEGVTIRPDGKAVYVTSEGDGDVAVIDTSTFKVLKRIPVGHRPRSVGFLPDGSRAYVTLENDGALAIIDTAGSRRSASCNSAIPPRRRVRGRWASRCGLTDPRCTSRPDRSAACSSSIRPRMPSPAHSPSDNAPGASRSHPTARRFTPRTDRRTISR